MASLVERAEAARMLVAQGEISPETALALTVWPSERLEKAPRSTRRRPVSGQEVALMIELSGEGLSASQIGERLHRNKATVLAALRQARARALAA